MAYALNTEDDPARKDHTDRTGQVEDKDTSTAMSMESIFSKTFVFQSLFRRLTETSVREAFVRGQFGVANNSDEMLISLDKLSALVSPVILGKGISKERREHLCALSAVFFMELLVFSTAEPQDCNGENLPVRQSYASWHDFLQALVNSSLWSLPCISSHSIHTPEVAQFMGKVTFSENNRPMASSSLAPCMITEGSLISQQDLRWLLKKIFSNTRADVELTKLLQRRNNCGATLHL